MYPQGKIRSDKMRLVFECNYCPAIFSDFTKLVRHYNTRHNQEQDRHLQDTASYAGPDSGCLLATEHLEGKQSSCLKCPFPKCKLEEKGVGLIRTKKRTRNEEIKKRFKKGESVPDLAIAFGVVKRTIERAVKR